MDTNALVVSIFALICLAKVGWLIVSLSAEVRRLRRLTRAIVDTLSADELARIMSSRPELRSLDEI